ncbi:tol-pal system protein YbgF [Dyella sp. GSA-30]|uniref:tol-pal system protein YbgF n=1 Tax=Dyella sp. GSA-30 TaxID=2994496 RepID=UPI00248F5153|nr:tol-pal system protein YbgF [Dyella sp. GSA-30]BDU23085.1 tol-pal system protein YbgF [Dyella sp. GSA-30]
MNKQLATSFTARLGMAGALASAMLFALPVQAQDSRLSLADRVARLEQQAQNRDQGGIGMVNQVQQLQQQVQQLQGQIEELQHQVQEAQDKNKAQYVDLDSRLGRLEKGGSPAAANNPPPATDTPPAADNGKPQGDVQVSASRPAAASSNGGNANPAGAQAAYDAAFGAIRGGDYVKASRGFREFLQQYPDSNLAPNAYYWLGESYYATSNYPVALEAFQRLVSRYPQSDKAPDGLLKVAYTQIELKQNDAAKATLKSVPVKYPGSKAAGLAQERLRRLQVQSAN